MANYRYYEVIREREHIGTYKTLKTVIQAAQRISPIDLGYTLEQPQIYMRSKSGSSYTSARVWPTRGPRYEEYRGGYPASAPPTREKMSITTKSPPIHTLVTVTELLNALQQLVDECDTSELFDPNLEGP